MAYMKDEITMLTYIRDYKEYLLSKDQQLELLAKYKETHDIEIRDKILMSSLGIIGMHVHIYIRGNPHIDPDELFDEGLIAVFRAIDKFSFDKNVNFITFLNIVIRTTFLMYLRRHKNDLKSLIHLDDILVNSKYNEQYEVHEIISSDIDIENEVLSSIEMCRQITNASEAMNLLSDNEAYVIYHRCILDTPISQSKIAEILNISQSYVCRLEKQALKKIREYMMKKESI